MMRSLWADIKQQYAYGNMVTRIIIVNVAIFVVINLLRVFLFIAGQGSVPGFYKEIIRYLSISADWFWTLTHPWVLITATFLHEGFFHILWNMLLLFWFGRIVGDFIGNRRVLPIYIMGGLAGALAFIGAALAMKIGTMAYGASAGVMAMVLAAGTLSPDYEMRLMFIGNVKLKYIVAVMIFIDVISIPLMFNTGGHIAHLGGALYGWLYIVFLRRGTDLALPFFWIIRQWPTKPIRGFKTKKSKPRFTILKGGLDADDSKGGRVSDNIDYEHKLDMILQKIKKDGYDSLSPEEKEFLYQASKR
jgi:membrane associated rhomboid family serine protease